MPGVHAAWTERRRVFELLNIRRLAARLRALVWLSGGAIRWKTIATILEAGYADAFRACTVHDHAGTREASDHLPLGAEIDA